MTTPTPQAAFGQGLVAALPFLLVVVPFGALFGIVATGAGLNVAETMGFTVLVIAGASQFTAVALLESATPIWLVLATSLAVNLRMAMYSASLAVHLNAAPPWQRALVAYLILDQTYAVAVARYEQDPTLSVPARAAFFFGTAAVVAPTWYAATFAGAVGGGVVPEGIALDFAIPVTFLALIGPMLRTAAHVAAAATSIALALALAWMPSGVGLLIAAAAALAVGGAVERRTT